MKLSQLLAEEREFIVRSLAFCGIRIIVPLSSFQGRFKLSEIELVDQDIQEIHLLDTAYEGITSKLFDFGFMEKCKVGNWTIFVTPEEVLHEELFSGSFKVGNLVIVNGGFLGEPSGVRGLVYHVYENNVCAIITENGVDLGGFNERDQKDFLIFIKDTFFRYQFKSVLKLSLDWNNGLFNLIFK